MKHDDDRCCFGSIPRMVVRIVFSVIILVIVLSIVIAVLRGVFGLATGGELMPGWAWTIIGIIVALWLLSWLFRMAFRPWAGRNRDWIWDDRREIRILRRRYARGEISEVQFKKMMKNLKEAE